MALTLGGCTGDSDVDPVAKPKPASPSPEVRRQLQVRGSAAFVVADYWDSIQRGALPLSLDRYRPQVVDAVGLPTFAGMLAGQQTQAQLVRLNVLDVERAPGGQLVSAEMLPKTGPKVRHSFFVRRSRGQLRLAYDSFTAAALQQYALNRMQRTVDPDAEAPSPKSNKAADVALDAYREAGLSQIRDANGE